jgi:hypothetical protein
VERADTSRNPGKWQGCALALGGLLLACILLVFLPTGYAVYRYRAAQVFSGSVIASGQPIKLPTQNADTYTLTLQPQSTTPGGLTLSFTLRDNFGRTLAASTDFYGTGCPSSNAPDETCSAQSRDFLIRDSLGGPLQLALQSAQANIRVAVQVRDESAGGIFASGSLFLFGAFFGCGSLLWIVCVVLIVLFVRRLERPQSLQRRENGSRQESNDE